ncbi:hypothetical protein Tsubulata_313111 [Turnera subulata]|uniref:Receptor-like serine/threonine-protein kinase n=1 Tax=Turnera subulata TaxID=218843 RepID=A0A9Q0J4N5_9ROSI|nr:hypothetical protein Tsubulata_313111 [Turnera subulata]
MNPAKVFLIWLLKLVLLQICVSKDTIGANESVADGETLVSSGQTFTLGFFSAGNSSNRYVGIWFTRTSFIAHSVVWVANRDNPISDKSGVLSINSEGNLVLYAKNQTIPIWSTNVTAVSSAGSSVAQLSDLGNLVLVRQDSNSVTWQSWDHPVNSLFAFSKIGIDYRTGLNRFLTSWKSPDDPGTGDFSLRMKPKGSPELFLYKGQVPIWRTGPWDGYKVNGVPGTGRSFIYNYILVNNNDETTFTWDTTNASIISTYYLDESGLFTRALWQDEERKWVIFYTAPDEACDNYGHCGPFGLCDPYIPGAYECRCLPGFQPKRPNDWYLRDWAGGCVRNPGALTCRNGEGFVKIANAKLPDTSVARVNLSLDLKACKKECLRDCSCMAYALADLRTGVGCTAWYGNLNDTRVFSFSGQDLYIRVDAAELAKYTKSAKKGMLAVIVISVAVPVILVICFLYWWVQRKRNGRECHSESVDNNSTSVLLFGDRAKDELFDESLLAINVHAILAATNEFSSENKLGEGGFGTVYKGQLANGQEIAVKRLSKTSRQGVEEFKNEVRLISKLQHKNLVRLYGCCIHGEEKMLVYEFLPNRSLDFFIFDKTRRSLLDWGKRFEIIMGIARGLLYLHQDSRLKIIHRDLKPSNVLLDAAMNPKISDFGMAKIFGDEQTEANTSRVMGTYGYMSPEYAMDGHYSIKSDVFSYGVLMLEIISARRNNGYAINENPTNLIGHVKRPTMSSILYMLGSETTTLPSPRRPVFVFNTWKSSLDSSSARTASMNDVSVTIMEPR